MKTNTVKAIGLLALTTALLARPAPGASVNFDQATPGKLPAGWSSAITGTGEPKWTVEKDDSAPSKPHVLKQSAETPRPSYPLCVKDDSKLQDGFVEVKFKSVSGKIDQAAGVALFAGIRASVRIVHQPTQHMKWTTGQKMKVGRTRHRIHSMPGTSGEPIASSAG